MQVVQNSGVPSGISFFDGCKHAHGTVVLVRRTWEKFLTSMHAQYKSDLDHWLRKHADLTHGMKVPLDTFDQEFSSLVKNWKWILNETPDGPV